MAAHIDVAVGVGRPEASSLTLRLSLLRFLTASIVQVLVAPPGLLVLVLHLDAI